MWLLYRLVMPRGWTRKTWPEPPVLSAFFNLKLKQLYLPALAADLYTSNPLFEKLTRG